MSQDQAGSSPEELGSNGGSKAEQKVMISSYTILVIITLIVALTARADLSNSAQLATFVIVPVIFFLAIILFGATYYVQVRPKKD